MCFERGRWDAGYVLRGMSGYMLKGVSGSLLIRVNKLVLESREMRTFFFPVDGVEKVLRACRG